MGHDSHVVPKTNTQPARKAYLQLMSMCSNTGITTEAIEEAIKRVELQAFDLSSTHDQELGVTAIELEGVAQYYKWQVGNIKNIRSITRKG